MPVRSNARIKIVTKRSKVLDVLKPSLAKHTFRDCKQCAHFDAGTIGLIFVKFSIYLTILASIQSSLQTACYTFLHLEHWSFFKEPQCLQRVTGACWWLWLRLKLPSEGARSAKPLWKEFYGAGGVPGAGNCALPWARTARWTGARAASMLLLVWAQPGHTETLLLLEAATSKHCATQILLVSLNPFS